MCFTKITFQVISFAVKYWSNGAMKAMFLRHEGYLGVVGAFMKAWGMQERLASGGTDAEEAMSPLSSNDQLFQSQRHASKCWSENYVKSIVGRKTSKASPPSMEGLTLSEFELEHLGDMSLEPFPLLLSPVDYVPDTWDLTQDCKARVYWLECFKVGFVVSSLSVLLSSKELVV